LRAVWIQAQNQAVMKAIRRTSARFLLLLFLTTASAQETAKEFLRYVPGGFLNAGDFSSLPSSAKEGYAMGFVNGIMASGIVGADGEKVKMMSDCTHSMDAKQVAAILDKYVRDHPEGWHQSFAAHSLVALLGACPDLSKRLASH
jgi:hypothetical protein